MFVDACKMTAKTINGVSRENFKRNAESARDKILTLIARRNALKEAVADSNANWK